MIFLCLIWFMASFCADNQNQIEKTTDYHERVAHNTLQMQTSGVHTLQQMGIERYSLLAQANGQYMAKTSACQGRHLDSADKQRLIRDLEITRERIRTSPDLRQALFSQVQSLLSMHVELLPELYAHKAALDLAREKQMANMSEGEIEQYTHTWHQLNEEFKMTYITILEAWLYQSQKALEEETSEDDCVIS